MDSDGVGAEMTTIRYRTGIEIGMAIALVLIAAVAIVTHFNSTRMPNPEIGSIYKRVDDKSK